ncbi:MAG: ATP-dependent Clp protease ATP-binding subunit, partial [Verrucomicrobiales bacterium]|nr:ATP-dependent Clp protease ATP-binding subunit [Verrucomicrobiales bacterium]
DSHGVRCDFRNSIIIMTSNLGARKPNGTLGFGSDGESNSDNSSLEKDVGEAVAKAFRSEFINRITEIVMFHSLSTEAVRKILDLIVERMNGRLRTKGLRLLLSEDAAEWLIKKGFNEEFGARHMERTVEQSIAKPLSNLILSGKVYPGSMIRVEVRNQTVELDVSKFEI